MMLLPYIKEPATRLADAVDVDRGAATKGHDEGRWVQPAGVGIISTTEPPTIQAVL